MSAEHSPRRSSLLLKAALLLLAWPGAGRANEPFVVYSAARTPSAPAIDGRLDDACWRGAEPTSPFVRIGGEAAPVMTRGMARWDETALYIALVCEEPLLEELAGRERQGLAGHMDESIEIFVDSNHDHFTYLQFRVGIQGDRDTHRGNDLDPSLTSRWRGAARVNESDWTVEVALPLSLVDVKPSTAALLGLNLNRQRSVRADGMWTCWSDTKGGFHSPGRFGHLVFVEYAEWLSAYFGQRVHSCVQELQALGRRYPSQAAESQRRVADVQRSLQDFREAIATESPQEGHRCTPLYQRGASILADCEEALSAVRLSLIRHEFE